MKQVEVKDQIRLPLGKSVELVLSGIRFRLFRAAITVAIAALAVAFLTTMLAESLTAGRVAGAVREQTRPRRLMLFWVDRLTAAMTGGRLADELAGASAGDDRWLELAAWGGLNEPGMRRLVDVAKRQKMYEGFFRGLSEGNRRALIGRTSEAEAFGRLHDDEAFAAFVGGLKELSGRLPGTVDDFRAFIADWNDTAGARAAVMAGHAAAIDAFSKSESADGSAARNDPKAMLAEADDSFTSRLGRFNFRIGTGEMELVRRQAALSMDVDAVLSSLKDLSFKARLASRLGAKDAADITERILLDHVKSASGAGWFLGVFNCPRPLTADMVRLAAEDRLNQVNLAEVEAAVNQEAGAGGGFGWWGFSRRTAWLLLVSFLVCAVGIVNAMLMSVTERFREIATMKCLGATDGFIMLSFIIESLMQGAAGGMVGAALGIMLGALRSWAAFGWMAMRHFPLMEIMTAGLAAVLAGSVLSAVAAVYPARVAARLAPMEAMRIE